MPDGPALIAVMDTVYKIFFLLERLQGLANSVTIHVQSDNDQNYAVEPSQLRCLPLLSNIVCGAG